LRILKLTAVLIACSIAAACGKAPAEAALKAADAAIEAAKPEVEKYLPSEFASLSDAARAAHGKFAQGDYKGALEGAQGLPAKVQAAVAAAAAKKEELSRAWATLSASLPKTIESLKAQVAKLSALKKLPAGLDKAKLESAKSALGPMTQSWADAGEAFNSGNIPRAVEKATALNAQAEATLASLMPAPTTTPAAHTKPKPKAKSKTKTTK
jgi:hypothetical protein